MSDDLKALMHDALASYTAAGVDGSEGARAMKEGLARIEALEARAEKAEAERDALREALKFYAVPENWHIGGPLDGNSGNFIGDRPARAALNREADT